MKNLLISTLSLMLWSNLAHSTTCSGILEAASSDLASEQFYDPQLDLVEMTIEALPQGDHRYDHLFPYWPESVASDCSAQKHPQKVPPASSNGVDPVNQIISTGERIWKIVESNRPVVHSQLPRAHALPRGVSCWTDLQMWSLPQVQDFKISYKNAYGMSVIDFIYRVSYTSGGNFEDQGAFLSNVSIQAATLNVSWGFTFSATAQVGQVVNMGSNQNPLAGMEMIVNWKAGSVLRHMESTQSVFITGDGQLRQL